MGHLSAGEGVDIMKNLFLLKNKRGQIFTLLAIALIVLMFVSIEVYSSIREKQIIKDRVESMDSFLKALEANLERQVSTSGMRIIAMAYSEVSTSAAPIDDIDDFFEEAFFNGTLNGESNNLMIGATNGSIVEEMNEKAAKINVDITLLYTNITIEHHDPWTLKFTMTSDFYMRDVQGLATWNKTQNITSYIGINGRFDDPLYVMRTNGLAKKINATIYEGYYNDSGDLTNLSLHFNRGYFAANSNAPSFLKRLEGNMSADPNGIESFVDTRLLPSNIVNEYDPASTKSVIDYIYFDKTNPTSGSAVSGMPSVFRIDNAHRAKYQLS